jgi:hypothetical protein
MARDPSWRFSGSVGAGFRAGGVHWRYQQLEFKFKSASGADRLGSVRLYDRRLHRDGPF